ncbi:MAG: acetyl-CoA carboxylase biotin carboxyl carrier protein subunit [Spirochaetales bacterium]|nr:acetyl-CoA carboxylase biotin carboxyl carrier protein subunit [Spirochaetales bacterium]
MIKKFEQDGVPIQLSTTKANRGFLVAQSIKDQPATEIRVLSFQTVGQRFFLETEEGMCEGSFVCVEDEIFIHLAGHSYHFKAPPRHPVQGGSGEYKSPLPGKVIQLAVKVGDSVQTGQSLAIVEAMKMENAIKADRDGTVTEILCEKDEIVGQGQVLIRVQPLSA